MSITYRKTGDEEYEATDGEHTVTVLKGWERLGGWQWIVPEVKEGRWHVKASTRKAASERALNLLARKSADPGFGDPVRCPANHPTGRQVPIYETGNGLPVATGRFYCEVCRITYSV